MDDYLKKFGFTPRDLGIEAFVNNKTPSPERSQSGRTDGTNMHNGGTTHNELSRFDNVALKDLPLTMAYVPMQSIESTYDENEALKAGTLFPNLDKPFLGRKI